MLLKGRAAHTIWVGPAYVGGQVQVSRMGLHLLPVPGGQFSPASEWRLVAVAAGGLAVAGGVAVAGAAGLGDLGGGVAE